MWNGKTKAVTFSYDDGITQDRRLVEIFNKYGLKCTFNLNSGIQTGANRFTIDGVEISRMNMKGLRELYRGHEIACHTLTHPNLAEQDDETVYNEILRDKHNLESFFECEVKGLAYPYGAFDDRIVNIVADCGIKYARTVWDNGSFALQDDLLRFRATCRHGADNVMQLAEDFLADNSGEPRLFYIWGHSYEFDVNNNWELIEELCRMLSGRDDIFYGTNSEVFNI